jgi:hypothetical protein
LHIECGRGPKITVDKLEVAQFLYLLLERHAVTSFIEGVSSKVVLILGRFTPARKAVLESIADALRSHDYAPVLFDFDAGTLDLVETVTLLARMSRFIVADLSDPASVPMELQAIVPELEIPVQPLILESERPFATFQSLLRYPTLLPLRRYKDAAALTSQIEEMVIAPAEAKHREIVERRRSLAAAG